MQFQKLTNRSNYIIIAFKFKVIYSYCMKYSYIALAIAVYLQLGATYKQQNRMLRSLTDHSTWCMLSDNIVNKLECVIKSLEEHM